MKKKWMRNKKKKSPKKPLTSIDLSLVSCLSIRLKLNIPSEAQFALLDGRWHARLVEYFAGFF